MDYFNDVFTSLPVIVNGGTESSQISSKISVFVFRRWTKVLWVWNDM